MAEPPPYRYLSFITDHLAADATTPLAVATCAQVRPDLTEALLYRLMWIGPRPETNRTVSGSLSRPLGAPLRSGHHCSGVLQALCNGSMAGGGLLSLLHLRRSVRMIEPALAAQSGGSYWENANGEPQHVDEGESQLLHWDADTVSRPATGVAS